MASTINASSTANGIVSTADASGILNIQSNGVNTNAQAWVQFNGNGGATIGASYNISSVTRSATGAYVINFTNAFVDSNYASVFGLSGVGNPYVCGLQVASKSSSSIGITTSTNISSVGDAQYASLACFR